MINDFMPVEDHYRLLLSSASKEVQDMHMDFKNTRTELAFTGRRFVVYTMEGREPKVLDRFTVNDFQCDDEAGMSSEIISTVSGKTMTLNYVPQQLFENDVLIWLPLHSHIRWSRRDDKTSLAFSLVLRTRSRIHPRERGVVHCEPSSLFATEFEIQS